MSGIATCGSEGAWTWEPVSGPLLARGPSAGGACADASLAGQRRTDWRQPKTEAVGGGMIRDHARVPTPPCARSGYCKRLFEHRSYPGLRNLNAGVRSGPDTAP